AGATALGLPLAAHPETARRLDFPVARLVEEGEAWPLGGGWNPVALHTPGHAAGHLCLWEPQRRVLLAGDLTAGYGTILIDPDEGSMAGYLDSLRRVQRLKPRLVVSAHGPPFGPGSDLPGRLIEHRLQRERRVLASLPGTLEELLERAYAEVDAKELARRSLLAHLLKLEEEGRARRTDDGWAA
ncbi:MAG: MBL fold metallo-hydrolase, partial [Candidatus Eremiobacterota bacterium]